MGGRQVTLSYTFQIMFFPVNPADRTSVRTIHHALQLTSMNCSYLSVLVDNEILYQLALLCSSLVAFQRET